MRNMTALMLRVTFVALIAVTVADVRVAMAGAPLKGVDVKLGRNPGGAVVRTVRTDEHGKFDFGVLPRGSYVIVIGSEAGSAPAGNSAGPTLTISLSGTAAGSLTYLQDLKSGSLSIQGSTSSQRSAAGSAPPTPVKAITFDSDGQHPVNGTVVKSKSNITNN